MTTHPTCRAADADMVQIVRAAIFNEAKRLDMSLTGPLIHGDPVALMARAAIAAYEAALAASGYVIVPRVPTSRMLRALKDTDSDAEAWNYVLDAALYDAALAQSAPPAKPQEGTSP